ncbi:MAG: serine/threonine protein kinase [Deltaproteobacteria bacterium]|nr:serine/threonine protein kinase [Deltaproteobacteria bacterium]
MSTAPRFVGRPPPSTPEVESSRDRGRDLPDDVLREASRRLGILSLVMAALWAVGAGLDHLAVWAITDGDPRWLRADEDDAFAAGSIAVSVGLFLHSRVSKRNPRFVLDLGLAYMVLMALALGLLLHWQPRSSDTRIEPMISWCGVLVLIFAAIVPATPRKMLVAGLSAASMAPVVMLVQKARGQWDFGAWTHVWIVHYPDYVLVGVSVVISRVVSRWGQQLVRARDLGSYQLGELIGSGGMGRVYRATHRMLARPAAIKLIGREALGDEGSETARLAVKRFRREAEVAARLQSPHTVGLYDFGVTDEGTLFLVMELLDGMNLEALVRQKGPVPAARAIHILRQACESLHEAHAAGLVHRDIKPANIHLGRLGLHHDFVKVLDFGLVKSVTEKPDGESLATAAGLTPGTPAYMAPEMARGEVLDGRTDLYALGCVGYYLLTGHLVFEATGSVQMIARHLQAAPAPPSQRAELPVPPELDRLILACLAKDPKERPATAAELGRSLGAIAAEAWSEEQAAEWWQSNQPAPRPA